MKKATVFCLVICLVLSMFAGSALAAVSYEEEVKPHAVMLLDATTGQVLYEKNADEKIYPASTTKIMTCILALEKGNLDDMVTIGQEGDWTGSGYSLMGLKKGQQISLRELVYGMMLISGNDAAAAIAVHLGGSIEGFAQMMNDKAQELGMTGSHFLTPHGVDTDGHYVTARDMATLSLYAMKNEQFMQIVGSASYDFPSMKNLKDEDKKNTNKLLISDVPEGQKNYYYEFATGIKTGATPKAFRCLVSSAEKDGMKLLCLIYGDETSDGSERWPLAKSLFEYGFNNYETVDISAMVANVPVSANVTGASADDAQAGVLSLNAALTGSGFVTLEKAAAEALKTGGLTAKVTLTAGETLQAPVKMGDSVGTVSYVDANGTEIAAGTLTISRDVNIDVPAPTEPAQQVTAQATVSPQPEKNNDGIGSWIWYALGGVLVVLIIFFAVGLIHANNQRKKRRKRSYAHKQSSTRMGRKN